MANNRELAAYIMEQLAELGEVRNIPMMGGYIFYYRERIFGGIYGDGFLVKITEAGRKYMPESEPQPPYEGACRRGAVFYGKGKRKDYREGKGPGCKKLCKVIG